MVVDKPLSDRGFHGEPSLRDSLIRAHDVIEKLAKARKTDTLEYDLVIEHLIDSPGIYFGPGVRMEDVLRSLDHLGWIEIQDRKTVRVGIRPPKK
jgi:hypothetical protein